MGIITVEKRLKRFEGYVWKHGWTDLKNYNYDAESKQFLKTAPRDIRSLIKVTEAAELLMNNLGFIDNFTTESSSTETLLRNLQFSLNEFKKNG